jgi:hypothetical protein
MHTAVHEHTTRVQLRRNLVFACVSFGSRKEKEMPWKKAEQTVNWRNKLQGRRSEEGLHVTLPAVKQYSLATHTAPRVVRG